MSLTNPQKEIEDLRHFIIKVNKEAEEVFGNKYGPPAELAKRIIEAGWVKPTPVELHMEKMKEEVEKGNSLWFYGVEYVPKPTASPGVHDIEEFYRDEPSPESGRPSEINIETWIDKDDPETGLWIGKCAALNILSQGRTQNEAIIATRSAVALMLNVMGKRGLEYDHTGKP